ncbi:Uncharacterised protein [Klebsiella pneumoniae]|nr:Uncharacterised protein [Klebsiella pneumoniae]SYP80264.1 Uncharacterised protein [Klebsiella pneumoniae]
MNSVRYRDAKVIAMLAGDQEVIVASSSSDSAVIAQASGTGTGSSASASVITE